MVENKNTPTGIERRVAAALDGVNTLLMPTERYVIGDVPCTGAEIAQKLTEWLAAFRANRDARLLEKATTRARRAIEPEARDYLKVLNSFASGRFGAESEKLTSFGFKPRKRAAPLSAEQRLLKKERNAATRDARGTRGSRQKKSVKGQVPSTVTITTASTPPANGKKQP